MGDWGKLGDTLDTKGLSHSYSYSPFVPTALSRLLAAAGPRRALETKDFPVLDSRTFDVCRLQVTCYCVLWDCNGGRCELKSPCQCFPRFPKFTTPRTFVQHFFVYKINSQSQSLLAVGLWGREWGSVR